MFLGPLSRHASKGCAAVAHRLARTVRKHTYVWLGVGLGVVFWFLESWIHVMVFGEGTFSRQLFTLDVHELWKRLLIFALMILFGAYAQHGINVRRRSEEALRVSEKKYRTLIQEALNPIFVFGPDGRFREFNQSTLDFFELDSDSMAGTTYHKLAAQYPRFSGSSGASPPECGLVEKDFTVGQANKTLLLNIVPLAGEGEDQASYFGIGQDITERKLFQRNLEFAHRELAQIFQTASSAMRLIDRDFRVIKINETFAELAGVKADEAIGSKCFDVFPGERCHTADCPLVQILDGRKQIEYKLKKTKRDGSEATCLLTARPFFNSKGDPIGAVESFNDITELTRTQDALRSERDKLRNILFQQYEGVGILRADFTVEYQNESLVREFGDCVGRRCFEAFQGSTEPCLDCLMLEAIRTGSRSRCEIDSRNGRVFEHTYTPFLDIDNEQKILVYLHDVTEARASHAAAVQAEQLAAIGALSAGVAHEINNPINGIINYAQMLIDKQRRYDEIREISSRIVKEGDRIARIVASLLAYARRGVQEETTASVEELINESLTLIGAQMKKEAIGLDVRFSKHLPRVFCVPQEIQQVFLNIMSNARDALNRKYPDNEGIKRLEIFADVQESNGKRWVRVAFRDNGTGIDPAIRDKILKPFFSTKPKGKGTGLGLSISHDIIAHNGGELIIDSETGHSTTVEVRLPEVMM